MTFVEEVMEIVNKCDDLELLYQNLMIAYGTSSIPVIPKTYDNYKELIQEIFQSGTEGIRFIDDMETKGYGIVKKGTWHIEGCKYKESYRVRIRCNKCGKTTKLF